MTTTRAFEVGFAILKTDLRILVRKHFSGTTFQAKAMEAFGICAVVCFMVLLHSFAFAAATFSSKVNAAHPDAALAGISAIIWNFLIFVMASGGLIRALVVLHEQDDTDLLVTSPTSIRTILAARLFGNSLQSCVVDGFIIFPWINAMIFLHGWTYLFGYPIWLSLSIMISSLDGLFTLSLVRFLGLGKARAVAQIVPFTLVFAITFASLAATMAANEISQPNPSVPIFLQADINALGRSPVAWASQAAHGAPLQFISIVLGAILTAWFTLKWTEKPFLEGIKSLREGENRAKPDFVPPPFSGNLIWLEMRKGFRLIARTPMILIQALSQALAPIGISIVLAKIHLAYGLGYFAIFVSGILSGIFTIAAGTVEPCSDLLRMSPRSLWQFQLGKILTGCGLPCVFLIICSAGFAVMGLFLTAAAVLFAGVPLAVTCSYVGESFAQPTPPGVRPKLLSSPIMILPLFGMQMGSGLIAAASIIGSAFNVYFLVPSLIFCYLILFLAWGLTQLKSAS